MALFASLALPAWPQQNLNDLADRSLEELMNVQVQVTSVSKKEENSFQAPAAIFVLTAEDIRRGGFASLPEALRMVPGLYVARTDSNNWTIAARGFAEPNNDKLLVLLDGREMYDPYSGGTNWEAVDVPLEDVERIEVILGPGGTLWGDNAVNGVINIITKSSKQTQGASVAISSGTDEEHTASVRYGGTLGGLSYRVYGKSSYWDSAVDPSTGVSEGDEWSISQGGFRADWKLSENDNLQMEGQVYEGRTHNTELFTTGVTVPMAPLRTSAVIAGQSFLTRWDHKLSERASLSVLGYCTWTRSSDPLAAYNRNTCDLEFQHNLAIGSRQSLNWGGTFFTTGDELPENFMVRYSHPSARKTTVSGFGQYEIKLIPNRLRIIAGSKFEHNGYTGFEIQPQIRAVWTPAKSQAVWGAVSRAVKLPNRVQTDIDLKVAQLPGLPPTYIAFAGNPLLQSEILKAYEMGYRWEVTPTFSLDASIYYNQYNKITSSTPLVPVINPVPFYVELQTTETNVATGQTHGGEFYARFRPIRSWYLSAGVTELRGSSGFVVADMPRHSLNVQSHWDLPHRFEFDAALYYTNAIPGFGFLGPGPPIPTHNRVDLGLSAHPMRGLTLSVWGNDIGAARKLESTTAGSGGFDEVGAVRRSVVVKLMWQPDTEKRKNNP